MDLRLADLMLSTRGGHHDVLNLRADVLRLVPIRSAMLVRQAIDNDARATWRQRGYRCTDHDGRGHAHGYPDRDGGVPAVTVVMVIVVVVVVIVVMSIVMVVVTAATMMVITAPVSWLSAAATAATVRRLTAPMWRLTTAMGRLSSSASRCGST
jgi:hypothetical protein